MISCNSSHPVLSVVVCQISTGCFFCSTDCFGGNSCLKGTLDIGFVWFRVVFGREMRFLPLGCLSKSRTVRIGVTWDLYK